MIAEFIDRALLRIPFIQTAYARNAGRLKRRYCLFAHRLGLLKPYTFVQWLVTYRCNFNCPYCEATAGAPAKNELSTAESKAFIDELAQMKIKRLALSGGEPLVRKDIIHLMDYANSRGIHLGLITNGFLVESMWSHLKELKYFLYFTSIDGTEAYNDNIRGKKGAFARALKALELFASIGVKLRMVNTVVTPENIGQLNEMAQVIKESAATLWVLTPAAKVGKAAHTDKYGLNASEICLLVDFIEEHQGSMNVDLGESHRYIKNILGKTFGKPFFCGAGLTRCSVMPEGQVLGCHQVYDNAFSEGNIRKEGFADIWKNRFSRFRERKLPDKCNKCGFVSSCQGGCWAELTLHNDCFLSLLEGEGRQ